MPKPSQPLDVVCPCCQARLRVDKDTGAVLSHEAPPKQKTFEDFGDAVKSFQSEAGRREQAFQKSLNDHRMQKDVLAKKFDELFKKAKEDPNELPPPREFDLD